jgi:sulfate permease, SulP family
MRLPPTSVHTVRIDGASPEVRRSTSSDVEDARCNRATYRPYTETAAANDAAPREPRGLSRVLPILDWLPRYERRWLRGDVAAGIAVTALIVPKNLGYAGIAGVPLQNGLYAAAAGALIYALFCTSRQISTGPSSSLAAVAGGAVVVTGLGGDHAAQLVAAITLVTGVLFVLLSVFKLGRVAQFLSKAVVTGFLAGAAVDVVIGELPKLTGTSGDGTNAWQELSSWVRSLSGIHWTTFVVGLVALAVIFGLRFVAPAVPGALVLVVGGLVAAWVFDLGAHGVALVGHVPRGLPAPAFPGVDLFVHHFAAIGTAALALLLIGFSQTAGDARAFASRHRYRIDINQESLGQGMANVGAGLFKGMPVSTSLSASSLNESAGARTPLASLITGGLVLLTLIALAPLFSSLPKAVLGAVIIDAVVFGMIDIAELRRLYRVKRFDFWIAIAAFLAVLSAGVLAGVVIGVALSLAWLVYVATAPSMPLLAREVDTQVFREFDEHPDDETFPGIAVVRMDSGLFFATADALHDRLRDITQSSDPPVRAIVLDFEGVNFIDSQGAGKLTELGELADSYGVTLRLARLKTRVRETLEADGVIDKLGANRIHGNVYKAVQAERAAERLDHERVLATASPSN